MCVSRQVMRKISPVANSICVDRCSFPFVRLYPFCAPSSSHAVRNSIGESTVAIHLMIGKTPVWTFSYTICSLLELSVFPTELDIFISLKSTPLIRPRMIPSESRIVLVSHSLWQSFRCESIPAQSSPSPAGCGLAHVLPRTLTPLPQLTGPLDHSDQLPHFPSTGHCVVLHRSDKSA